LSATTAGEARRLVTEYYEAFNAFELDRFGRVIAEDIELMAEGRWLHGRERVLDYVAEIHQQFPGASVDWTFTAVTPERVVVEYAVPAVDSAACELFEIRDGSIAVVRNYHVWRDRGRPGPGPVPEAGDAYKIVVEQTALRRVATLVVEAAPQDAIFAAVNEEVGRIVAADATALFRFDEGDGMRLLAAWSPDAAALPVGDARPINDAVRELRESGRPRLYDGLPEGTPLLDDTRERGLRSAIGVPLFVEGRAWGVVFAASREPELFAGDAVDRLARFTELAGTALANTQARERLEELAREQAALRRIAELVARGGAVEEVSAAVADVTATLIERAEVVLSRFDDQEASVVVARTGAGEGAEAGPVRVAVPITVDGRPWGTLEALAARPLPGRTEERLRQIADLVALAVMNTENRVRLVASRARVISAADASRRQVQRDLHDGAQQRLVHTIINLKLATDALAAGSGADQHVADALRQAELANTELRDLARGILPTRRGLRAAVETVAEDLPIPVEVNIGRLALPASVETTAYFVIMEALTNVVKHARAGGARVSAALDDGALAIEIHDDGAGGAALGRGTGLRGLADRVEASEGSFAVESPPGGGTVVRVSVPLPAED
jgi:signal transduction histidine kinase